MAWAIELRAIAASTPLVASAPFVRATLERTVDGPGALEVTLRPDQLEGWVPGLREVRVLRDDTPIWGGYLTGLTRQTRRGSEEHVEARCVGYSDILRYRHVVGDFSRPATVATTVAWDLIAHTQAQPGGDLGLTLGTVVGTAIAVTRHLCDGDNVADAINELANAAGFDWDIDAERRFVAWVGGRGQDLTASVSFGPEDVLEFEQQEEHADLPTHAIAIGDADEPCGPPVLARSSQLAASHPRREIIVDVGRDAQDEMERAADAELAARTRARLRVRVLTEPRVDRRGLMGLDVGDRVYARRLPQLPVPGPAVWYRAEDLLVLGLTDGARVERWPDRSGNGRDATQVTASYRPTLRAQDAPINLLPLRNQSDVDTDTTGFHPIGQATLTRVTSPVWQGSGALQIVGPGTTTFSEGASVGDHGSAANNVPVVGGRTYTASAFARGNVGGEQLGVSIRWRDSSGVMISTETGPLVSLTTSFSRLSLSATAPTGAAWAAILVLGPTSGGVAVPQTTFIDSVQFEEGATATPWEPSAWTRDLHGPYVRFQRGVAGASATWLDFSATVGRAFTVAALARAYAPLQSGGNFDGVLWRSVDGTRLRMLEHTTSAVWWLRHQTAGGPTRPVTFQASTRLIGRVDGAGSATVWANGSSATGANAWPDDTATSWRLGWVDGAAAWADLAEFVLYDRALSDAEVTDLDRYLASRTVEMRLVDQTLSLEPPDLAWAELGWEVAS